MDGHVSKRLVLDELKNMYISADKWKKDAKDEIVKARAESCMATLVEMKLRVEKLISAEEESFEWCDTCKEYDQEKHCCHRFSKVIRQAFEEMKVVHCIDCRHSEYDEVYKDRYCHYNGKAEVVDDYHYCRDGERRDDE